MIAAGYVKNTRGSVFQPETGKLFIFDDNRVSVLRGWPAMRAWKKTCVKHPNWIGFRPSLSLLESELRRDGEHSENYRRTIESGQLELLLPFRYRSDGNPYGSEISRWYFETTPREVRDLLAPFGSSRWALMSFLAVGGTGAKELLQSAPALAFMLANNRLFHTPAITQPLRAIRSWLKPGKKRRDLAGWLGLPPTKSTLHLLSKIPVTDISIPMMLKIKELIVDPGYEKLLRHLPVIDRASISFFDPGMRDFLTPKLLTQMRAWLLRHLDNAFANKFNRRAADEPRRFEDYKRYWKKDEQYIWQLFQTVSRLFRQFRPGEKIKIPNADALVNRDNQLEREEAYQAIADAKFQPPLPGNDSIIPIGDMKMLCDEGVRQHNCVATFGQEILDGKSAIYRVLKPERCTLELVPDQGKWVINQLYAACNREPKKETQEAVQQWLDEVQQ